MGARRVKCSLCGNKDHKGDCPPVKPTKSKNKYQKKQKTFQAGLLIS